MKPPTRSIGVRFAASLFSARALATTVALAVAAHAQRPLTTEMESRPVVLPPGQSGVSWPVRALRYQEGVDFLNREIGALAYIHERVTTMRVLTVLAAAEPSLVPREILMTQAMQEVETILAVIRTTSLRGRPFLDGSYYDVGIQSAPGGTEFLITHVNDVMPETLGIDLVDLTTAAQASAALAYIDVAMETIETCWIWAHHDLWLLIP